MPRQLVSKAIQIDQISLEHCDWYSQDATAGESTGALKLPRGNTNERPSTHTGGRENIEINLTVSQPDVPSSDPNFLQMDPCNRLQFQNLLQILSLNRIVKLDNKIHSQI